MYENKKSLRFYRFYLFHQFKVCFPLELQKNKQLSIQSPDSIKLLTKGSTSSEPIINIDRVATRFPIKKFVASIFIMDRHILWQVDVCWLFILK